MGAVFTSAARAPLTSLASVVEMSGDFTLTLPVMLAVAIASTVSRALSYGTIYTTKLLRRGTDIDRAAPWRALADMKIADVMRPFRPALPVPPDATAQAHSGSADGNGSAVRTEALSGLVTGRHDPQALFASESLSQALRQLEVYGRDGLPVLSADGRQVQGWATSASVLRALARQVAGARDEAAHAQAAADWDHEDPASAAAHPPAPLSGYQVIEITITDGSPAAGQRLGGVRWPPASVPVSVLHGTRLRPPSPDITLAAGDRVRLLVPVAQNGSSPDLDGASRGQTGSRESSDA
jgi:chloride channel protein, CIC family